jgi:rubrerythrin
MSTTDNLQAAFAGESQANRKYLAFARKAQRDGKPGLAKLFRAAAAAETVHAHAHFRVMGGIKSSAENVQAAIAGEGYEVKEMYPEFVEAAQSEGHKAAEISFSHALEVEKQHHELYSEAAKLIEEGGDAPDTPIVVCDVCGCTLRGEAPDSCPVCNSSGDHFMTIE